MCGVTEDTRTAGRAPEGITPTTGLGPRQISPRATGARPRPGLLILAVLALGLAVAATGLGATASRAASPTVVSITFDDGHASQASAAAMLDARGMDGTFYINSGWVGTSSYYLTWQQIHGVKANGHEIGGHTVNHTNLTGVSSATATREVCDDRTNLINQGLGPITSFAYPEAAANSTARSAVASCYPNALDSGRGVGGGTESIPPADRYVLRTPAGITTSTTLANLQQYVTSAENSGGGWVPLVFHGICDDNCTGVNSMRTATFTAFLDWLAPRAATGTVVRTVAAAMSGGVPPAPTPTPTPTDTVAPTVALTAPANGATFPRKATITLAATASDNIGVSRVVFYDGSTAIGTDTTAPYGVTWSVRSNVQGSRTLTAVATDAAGNATRSAPVTVRIR